MTNKIDTQSMLRVGTILHGTYRIERYLSSGGFGNTYVAVHTEFNECYAVKEFFMKGVTQRDGDSITVSVSNAANQSQFAEQKEKFKKEARRLFNLSNVHVVKVYDLFEENGTVYYVMDFIDGESLSGRLRRLGAPFREEEVDKYLPQILDALACVHGQQIWHLDLKPANIMVDQGGVVKLIDFGASKQIRPDGGATTSTALCYTPGYAPNEQIGQNINKFGPWTDFYALGATLYHLLTMKRPPEPLDISEDGDGAFAFSSSISMKMQKLIIWLMQPNRNNRPQNETDINNKFFGNHVMSFPDSSVEEETICIEKGNSVPTSDRQVNLSFRIHDVTFKMIKVDGGTFAMGKKYKIFGDAESDESPVHSVTLSDYYIGQTEVTQALWNAVMGSNPSKFKGDNKPVENVSWNDCQTFIAKLNKLTGKTFCLSTEAQWEFAARGGNSSRGYKYGGSNNLGDVAWYDANSGSVTHDVGTKSANELGLYDMSGNVFEWCSDWYGDYGSNSQTNPTGPYSGSFRVSRGGSWGGDARFCRVSNRDGTPPGGRDRNLGLRLVL